MRMLIVLSVIVISAVIFSLLRERLEGYEDLGNLGNLGIATRMICSTRNSSYDLRGDVPIPRKHIGIMDSEIGPLDPVACSLPNALGVLGTFRT
jgi:hypothetical protein